MDHLSMVVKAAREAGMSYGKYVALQHELGRLPVPTTERRIAADEIEPLAERRCEICGALILHETRGGIKTCGPNCSYELNKRRNRERYQREVKFRPVSPAKCEYCGGEFIPNRRSQKFCGEKCRDAHKLAVKRGERDPLKQSERMRNRSYGIATCVVCGEEFTKRGARQLTCSERCRKVYFGKVK